MGDRRYVVTEVCSSSRTIQRQFVALNPASGPPPLERRDCRRRDTRQGVNRARNVTAAQLTELRGSLNSRWRARFSTTSDRSAGSSGGPDAGRSPGASLIAIGDVFADGAGCRFPALLPPSSYLLSAGLPPPPIANVLATIAVIFAAVANVFLAIAPVLPPVADVFTTVADVLAAIADAALM